MSATHDRRRATQPALTICTTDARRMLMGAQGLLRDPAAQARGEAGLLRLIEQMGFVQIDTISTVERAHHLILSSRSNAYRPVWLDSLAGRERRALFEHWTHDASYIPTRWFAHWRPRFARYRAGGWHLRQMGADADTIVTRVLERIRGEGPLRSADFEHFGERAPNAWWGWKPHKVALDYLWRIGELYVVGRQNFHKIYDLTERAADPRHHGAPHVSEADHLAWACTTALERLGVATPSEVANFWRAIPLASARAWLVSAAHEGRVVTVEVVSPTGAHAPRSGFALPDVKRAIRSLSDAPKGPRLLCPFDPVLRDRDRLKRLFDFDFRFEAFVPASKRKYGYYVMPLLVGDRLVARVDPKFHRDRGELRIERVWWEPNTRVEKRMERHLEFAVERLAEFLGATKVKIASRRR